MSSTQPLRWLLSLSMLVLALAAAGEALGQQSDGSAPSAPAGVTPPLDLTAPAAIEAGRAIFRVSCTTYCHGREARGGGHRGPGLRNGNFDNAYLFEVIAKGRGSMPAYAGVYTPEQIWETIAYIQSLKD